MFEHPYAHPMTPDGRLPLIHQAVPLSRPRKKITVTIELCSALTGASRPEHTQGSARLYIFETSMFEHP